MARSEAQKRAKDVYNSKHIFIQYATNERTRSLIKAEAARQGMSMNDYIKRAILNQLKADRSARSEEIESINDDDE